MIRKYNVGTTQKVTTGDFVLVNVNKKVRLKKKKKALESFFSKPGKVMEVSDTLSVRVEWKEDSDNPDAVHEWIQNDRYRVVPQSLYEKSVITEGHENDTESDEESEKEISGENEEENLNRIPESESNDFRYSSEDEYNK
jgi:hypothetical protein